MIGGEIDDVGIVGSKLPRPFIFLATSESQTQVEDLGDKKAIRTHLSFDLTSLDHSQILKH